MNRRLVPTSAAPDLLVRRGDPGLELLDPARDRGKVLAEFRHHGHHLVQKRVLIHGGEAAVPDHHLAVDHHGVDAAAALRVDELARCAVERHVGRILQVDQHQVGAPSRRDLSEVVTADRMGARRPSPRRGRGPPGPAPDRDR